MFKLILVPSENYFSDKFTQLRQKLEQQLSYASYINLIVNLKNALTGTYPKFEINIFGSKFTVIDFAWFDYAKKYYYWAIRGVFLFLLAKYNYNQIYRVLRNTSLLGSSNTMQMFDMKEDQLSQAETRLQNRSGGRRRW